MVRSLGFVTSLLGVANGAFPSGIATKLQQIAKEKSQKYNCSVSIAVKSKDDALAAAAGITDFSTGREAQTTDAYAWGSGTKPLTGASILKMVSEGKLSLTDTVSPLVDPFLAHMALKDASQNFTSLADLWGEENVTRITLDNLARMQTGIPDFDTAKGGGRSADYLRGLLYQYPEKAWTPLELMSVDWVAHHFKEKIGGYSSTNFMILGLVLAHQAGADSWQDFDQGMFLPEELKEKFQFGATGAPKDYTPVHGYDRTTYNVPEGSINDIDVWGVDGVFAGWTASDIVASTPDMADLTWAIYGPEPSIAPEEYAKLMRNDGKSENSDRHHFYGFATFNLNSATGHNSTSPYGISYGHKGATYGYQSQMGHFPALDFSMAVATNLENDNQAQPSEVWCFAYNAIASAMLGQEIDCTFVDTGYHGGGCSCSEIVEPSQVSV